MIKLIFCLRRKEGMSREEFQAYWKDTHGPLVARYAGTLGIRRYVQVHASDHEVSQALRASRGVTDEFDGVAELWFDDLDSVTEAASSPDGQEAANALLEDERRFIDLPRCAAFFGDVHEIVGGSGTG